ncbi:MAG TPA: DUF503 domain-containing protein [bacterium]|nr:DUF503 domain-containing protein [bacterium]
MVIGVLTVEFSIPDSNSLKDKRRLVQSLLDRLHNQFHVAAAEVDHQDSLRRAGIAVACVSTAGRHANQILSRVVGLIQRETDLVLVDYAMEIR